MYIAKYRLTKKWVNFN